MASKGGETEKEGSEPFFVFPKKRGMGLLGVRFRMLDPIRDNMPLAYVDMFAYRISNGVNPVLAKARTFPLFTPLEARAKGAADASVLPLMGSRIRNRILEAKVGSDPTCARERFWALAGDNNNLLITMGKTVVKNRKKLID